MSIIASTNNQELKTVERYEKLQNASIFFALSLVLSSCGVRGGLEYPKNTQTLEKANAESGQGKPKGAASKPHKNFLLDTLIN